MALLVREVALPPSDGAAPEAGRAFLERARPFLDQTAELSLVQRCLTYPGPGCAAGPDGLEEQRVVLSRLLEGRPRVRLAEGQRWGLLLRTGACDVPSP